MSNCIDTDLRTIGVILIVFIGSNILEKVNNSIHNMECLKPNYAKL